MYPVPIGSGLGEIRGLTFFCAGSDANMAEYRAYIMDKDGLISRAIGLVCPDMRPRWNMPSNSSRGTM
jgi:hypothetical protein